jgi:hypothetical protein
MRAPSRQLQDPAVAMDMHAPNTALLRTHDSLALFCSALPLICTLPLYVFPPPPTPPLQSPCATGRAWTRCCPLSSAWL